MLKTMIGALALAATLPAAAGETRLVRYDDLNLASPAGMERLQRRIDAAARGVCGDENSRRVLGVAAQAGIRACMAEAKAKAARQVTALDPNQARGG